MRLVSGWREQSGPKITVNEIREVYEYPAKNLLAL